MWLDVHGVRGVRVRGMCGVGAVRRLARLVAALVHMRVRAQLLAVLAVRPLLVLKVPQPLVVSLDLIAQRRVLNSCSLFVQFQTSDAVQSL